MTKTPQVENDPKAMNFGSTIAASTAPQSRIGTWANTVTDWFRSLGAGQSGPELDPPGGGSPYGGGGRYVRPAVSLPRLQTPSEAELAKLVFDVVAASQLPYAAERQNLARARNEGRVEIASADRQARAGTTAAYNQWRAATGDLDNRVGSVYDAAARNLAENMAIANQSLAERGFRPEAANPEMLAALGALGANARTYSLTRRMAGEDAARADMAGIGQITQAARGTLANTYALVLGQIGQQAAAAEAQARLDAENRIFALRREIEQLNNQTAIQEAMANAGR